MGRTVVVGAATLLIGLVAGLWLRIGGEAPPAEQVSEGADAGGDDGGHPVRRARHGLVDPLLDFEPAHSSLLEAVRTRVTDVCDQAVDDGRAREIGLYVRDMSSGASFGLGADRPFTVASLGKLPLLMALLMTEEITPGALQARAFYPLWLDENDEQTIAPRSAVRPGKSYTLAELAEAMIAESDNNATSLLLDAVDKETHGRVLIDLGLRTLWDVVDENGESTVTPRSYGLLFRVLYNATYLGEGSSVRALELLSRATIERGLRAGLPEGVTVAHKFGEYARLRRGVQEQQFHDCGIVYHPARPYLACVMTRGDSLGTLAEVVGEISRVLWSGFDALPRPDR